MRLRISASLLEMLVVLTIICILMGIMLPVFIKAKNYAVVGRCLTNMEQIYRALLVYSADHGGSAEHQIYPPSLAELNLPGGSTSCTGGGISYNTMWSLIVWPQYSAGNSNPVLVVDTNSRLHHNQAIGLFANGSVQRRVVNEDSPTDFGFWR